MKKIKKKLNLSKERINDLSKISQVKGGIYMNPDPTAVAAGSCVTCDFTAVGEYTCLTCDPL